MSAYAYSAEFSAEEQELIDKEFTRVADSTYLDHAGTTLYAESQIAAAAKLLQRDVICNPHTCRATGDYVDQVRFKILEFFNTTSHDYHVVFTANATAALRMVADHFQFADPENNSEEAGNFYYCQENHTSVLGMRELVQPSAIQALTKAQLLTNQFVSDQSELSASKSNSLVVFSAQCNFSGYKMPLSIIENIHKYGLQDQGKCVWSKTSAAAEKPLASNHYVCLDAASYVATNHLDLQRYRPDFVCISFYKIFGYPSGVGALLVSQRGSAMLRKRFYGGGTINYAYPYTMEHQLRHAFHERFEDGTLPFLSIVELLQGFRTVERLVPGSAAVHSMERVSRHVHALARYTEQQLQLLRHSNGEPLITCYNHGGYTDRQTQGGIVAFNVRTDKGDYVGFGEIACMAALHRILLRTGCCCNIGACQHHLGLDEALMDAIYKRGGRVCGDYNDLLDGQPTGIVRVSFGYMTNIKHVDNFLQMLRACYIKTLPRDRMCFIEERVSKLPKVLQQRALRMCPRILELVVYPVKSCAALKVSQAEGKRWPLTPQGLKFDRQWMIVENNGMALTQKKCSNLCLLKPRIANEQLELHYPGAKAPITIPLSLPATSTQCRSKVCRQPIVGQDCGDAVANWLSEQLGIEGLRLLRQHPDAIGDAAGAPQLSLVNQAQFLLINSASVGSLELDEPLQETIDRFRANIIIETKLPFEELSYKRLNIGNIHFQVDGPCTRCDVICINQSTGERSPNALTTVSRKQEGKLRFGIYISRVVDANAVKGNDQLYLACGDIIEPH